MKKIVVLLAFPIFVLSCTSGLHDYCGRVMSEADSLMEACQDSALAALSMLDDIEPRVKDLPKKDRMRYSLLYAKAMNKGYVDFTTDSLMLEVADYYNRYGNDREKLEANYLLGCVYRDLKNSPKAISYLYKSTEFAGTDNFSYLMLYRIHGQIATLLKSQALIEQAIGEYDLATQYAWLANDSLKAGVTISHKSLAYAMINQQDSAISLAEEAIQLVKNLGYTKYAAQISGGSIELLLNRGNYEKAKENINFYETYSGFYNNGTIDKGREPYYYVKGLYYLHADKPDSAKIMFEKCAEFMDDPNMKVMTYRGLSLLYDKIQIPDSTAKYAMLAYEANDSAYQFNAAQTLLSLEAAYNYSKYQEEAKSKAEQLVVLQRWLFGSILLIIAITVLSIYLYQRIRTRHQRRLDLLKGRYKTEKLLLQREMEELNALLEEREYIFDNKERLLIQRQKELNVEIQNKEQSIGELQARVSKYEHDLNIRDVARLEDEIQTSAIKNEFAYYTTHVRKHPKASQWTALMNFAKDNLPQLYLLLNNFGLSEKEMRVCFLTRMNFKPGEIATIIDCKISDVSLIRVRLLKKIYGLEGKAGDFDRRIMLMF